MRAVKILLKRYPAGEDLPSGAEKLMPREAKKLMELATLFFTAFVVGLSGAMMPGPLLTVAIGESARRGFVAGPLLVLGHGILELALVVALALGLSAWLSVPAVGRAIALVGGAFLVYMGWGMAKEAWQGKVELGVNPGLGNPSPGSRGLHPVLAGVLVSLSNPYWSLWWATVGLSYIVLSLKQGVPGLASFFAGHISSDLVWYSLVAAAVAGGRRFLSQGVYRAILVACGAFLVFLGASFIYMGATGRVSL